MNPAIKQAIEKAGSQAELARLINMKPNACNNAIYRGYFAPERARMIHDLYGIPYRELINPKLARALPN